MAITLAHFKAMCRIKQLHSNATGEFAWHVPCKYVLWWNTDTGDISIIENESVYLANPQDHMLGEFEAFEYAYPAYLLFNP